MKYKVIISFEIEIEASDISTVDYICKQAQPTHFEFTRKYRKAPSFRAGM